MNTIFKKLGILALLVLAPTFAFASLQMADGNDWAFYAFANGNVLQQIFSSIASLMSEPEYRSLITFISIIGVVMTAIMAGFSPQQYGPKFVIYIIGAFIVSYLTFSIKSNIVIKDTITGQYYVSSAPSVVVVPASVTSQTGRWLTEKIEQNFSIPGELTISQGGSFNLGTSIINASTKAQINDSGLRESLASYMNDCFIPSVGNGSINAADLVQSNKFWDSVNVTNPNLTTVVSSTTNLSFGSEVINANSNKVVSCPDAYGLLTQYIDFVAPLLMQESFNSWGNTSATAFLGSALDSANTWMGGSAINGADTIKQNAILNTLNPSIASLAASSNNGALATSVAMAQAEQQQKSGWVMGAAIFQETMGYLYSVLQAFIFGLVPIVMVAFLIPGFGIAIAKNFGKILVWLVLWEPMLAIVNYVVLSFGQADMHSAFGTTAGYSLETLPVISEATDNIMAAGGLLATMVPMLAWSLVNGAMAFTEFISHGIGSSVGAQAGAMAATGNISLNSVSMNNTSMNKADFASQTTVGMSPVQAQIGAGTLTNMNAGGLGLMSNGQNEGATFSMENSRKMAELQARGQSLQQDISATMQHMEGESGEVGYNKIKDAAQATANGVAKNFTKNGGHTDTTDFKAMAQALSAVSIAALADKASVTAISTGAEVKLTEKQMSAAIEAFKGVFKNATKNTSPAQTNALAQQVVNNADDKSKAFLASMFQSAGLSVKAGISNAKQDGTTLSSKADEKAQAGTSNSAGGSNSFTLTGSDIKTWSENLDSTIKYNESHGYKMTGDISNVAKDVQSLSNNISMMEQLLKERAQVSSLSMNTNNAAVVDAIRGMHGNTPSVDTSPIPSSLGIPGAIEKGAEGLTAAMNAIQAAAGASINNGVPEEVKNGTEGIKARVAAAGRAIEKQVNDEIGKQEFLTKNGLSQSVQNGQPEVNSKGEQLYVRAADLIASNEAVKKKYMAEVATKNGNFIQSTDENTLKDLQAKAASHLRRQTFAEWKQQIENKR